MKTYRVALLFGASVLGLPPLAGCGSPSSVDRFYGDIDVGGLDAKFQPSTVKKLCPSGSCYPGQQGYAHGQPFYFYNMGAVQTTALPPLTTKLANTVYDFPTGCASNTNYNPQTDPYPESVQYPIFATLPLATTAYGVVVLPFEVQTSVTGQSGNTCNDLKAASSIGPAAGPAGSFGAKAGSPGDVFLWAVIDPLSALNPGSPTLSVTPKPGWYNGLLLAYLDGGQVPTDGNGNLLAMDGVILDPSSPGLFANPTDPKVVILPYVPGEAGYSPIVHLHDWAVPAGTTAGTFTDLCPRGDHCLPNQVDLTAVKSAFNTIFIVASAP